MGTQSSVGHHRENSHGNRIDSKMQYYKIALSFACVALCASQNQAQDVQPKDACPQPGASAGERLKQINKAKKRSNARCYAFLSDYAKSNLESCDTGLISSKESKAQTVGDVLCERAYSLYNYESPPKFWFTALVEIGAYTSYCGGDRQEVQTGGKHLTLDQKLCCVRKGTTVKYRPCNGSK